MGDRAMSTKTVCVIGENLVDLFVDETGSVTPVPGGGPFNVARTISRLGHEVVLFSGISDDEFGRALQSTLATDGVTLALPRPLELPTSLAIVEVNSGRPRYKFLLDGTAAFQLEEKEARAAFAAMQDSVGAVYFGTLGLLVEPMATTGEALINEAPSSTMVVLDPNCRPSAIIDHDDYRRRLNRLFTRSDVVKLSTEDLAYLLPDVTSKEASNVILTLGTRCVIVTDGPDQVRVFSRTFDFSVDVPPVEVLDTLGAGDALVGGFITWWIGHDLDRSNLTDEHLVRQGVEAAVIISTYTCTRQGAEPPWTKEVSALQSWDWL